MAGRHRAVSPMSDHDSYVSNYSDDFEDDDPHDNKRYKTRSPVLRTATSDKGTKATSDKGTKEQSLRTRPASDRINRSNRSNRGGRGRGRFGRGSQTGRSSQEPKFDNIAKRVMSARRLKINELKNVNEELTQQIRDLKDENKLLKKTQLRTEKALQRFEDKESDLPQIMQRQQNEVRSLKDQIRKWREKYEKTDRYLRDAEDELEKVKFKLKKLKSVAEEKELPERSDLNKRLNQCELDIEERDVKIKELERHLQNIQKNHRHELGIERARQKESNKKMMELREENEKLEIVVKEKDKELQMKNIYANRMVKPPHRLPNSYNGTPTPPIKQRRPSLTEGMTPRERAKMMEEKRREDLRKQREMKERPKRSHRSSLSDSRPPRQLSVEKSPRTESENLSPRNKQSEQQQKAKRDKELRKKQEEEDRERERLEAEERERQAWEEKEQFLEEEARREDEERRNREERERLKKEAAERERLERIKREKEEQDMREREWREKQEREKREKREREEKDRRERERLEQERRAREERERLEADETFQEEKRKKELILQKLREIDEGGKQEEKKKTEHFFVTSPRENSMDSQGSRKSYTFSRPTENLHKGKPSHNDLNFPGSPTRRRKNLSNKDIDGLEKGGYNPSFASNKGASESTKNLSLFDDLPSKTKTNKTATKSKLMEDLFGSKDESGSKQNVIFDSSQSKKTEKSSTRSGFPWDDEVTRNKDIGTKRENSSTLFGGGNAFINDEELQPSSKSTNLRRPKQTTTTFQSRPAVSAIDHIVDDDIEEVIL